MSLSDAVQGARHTPQTITWKGQNLTGATLTATKRNVDTGDVTVVDGVFLVTDAANGVFTWTYGAGDVGTPGIYGVQIRATYTLFDATIELRWVVHSLQSATTVPALPLVGVSPDDAAWLAAASTAVPDGSDVMPVVDPAVAGNLAVLVTGGTFADAGYAASVTATPGSVVRRDAASGQIQNVVTGDYAIFGSSDAEGVVGESEYIGVRGTSINGIGGNSSSSGGNYHHTFGGPQFPDSAIVRLTGILTFLGASAATNRAAQLRELVASLPTVDPAVAGEPWLNSGVLTFSLG